MIFKDALKITLLFSDSMLPPARSTGWLPGLLATVSWVRDFSNLVGSNSSPKSDGSLKLVLCLNCQHFIRGLLNLFEKTQINPSCMGLADWTLLVLFFIFALDGVWLFLNRVDWCRKWASVSREGKHMLKNSHKRLWLFFYLTKMCMRQTML